MKVYCEDCMYFSKNANFCYIPFYKESCIKKDNIDWWAADPKKRNKHFDCLEFEEKAKLTFTFHFPFFERRVKVREWEPFSLTRLEYEMKKILKEEK